MEKDNSVKIGVTKCDYCDAPSVIAIGPLVLCNAHKSVAISLEKEAEDGAKSLKAAPIHLADQHKQKK